MIITFLYYGYKKALQVTAEPTRRPSGSSGMVQKGKQPAPRHVVSRTGTTHVSAVVPTANTQTQRDE